MTVTITEYQAENLRLDAKTLIDISRMMEVDGRFKIVPQLLDSIATDILELVATSEIGEGSVSGKEVVA